MPDSVLLLVVDDEPLVLLAAQEALETGGYAVLAVSGGPEAVAALDRQTDEIAGLVTDIRLGAAPDGWAVARHARALKPDMPVVYTTGDSAHDWPVHGVPNSVAIQKPYAIAQLVTAISTLLTTTEANRLG